MKIIYALFDQFNNIRYIGRCDKGRQSKRLSEHIYRSNKTTDPTNLWIKEMTNLNLKPRIQVIDEDGSLENEEFYIMYFKMIGFNLANKYIGQKKTNKSIEKQKKSLSDYINSDNYISSKGIKKKIKIKPEDRRYSSSTKGYYFRKDRNKYVVFLYRENKRVYIGSYDSEDEAKIAHQKASNEYFI